MKKHFSVKWKSSKQPRKQRKYRYNAILNIKRKMVSSHLSKSLKEKYKRRSFPLKKGDTVKVMRGNFKEKTAKIDQINLKKMKVVLEGIYKTKKDGTKILVKFDPSNLQINELNLEDKRRNDALERKIQIKNTN